jgi:hypothetical protein
MPRTELETAAGKGRVDERTERWVRSVAVGVVLRVAYAVVVAPSTRRRRRLLQWMEDIRAGKRAGTGRGPWPKRPGTTRYGLA